MFMSPIVILSGLATHTLVIQEAVALKLTLARNEHLHDEAHVIANAALISKIADAHNSTQALVRGQTQLVRSTNADESKYPPQPVTSTSAEVVVGTSHRWRFCLLAYSTLLAIFICLNLRSRRERKQRHEEHDQFYEQLSGVHAKGSSYEHDVLVQQKQWDGIFTYNQLSHHVIKYDEYKSISFPVLFMFSRTLLSSPKVTNEVVVSISLGVFFFGLAYLFEDPFKADVALKLSVDELQTLCNFITSLVGVLLGFYISTVYGRWWALRNDTLGSLWGAVDDICCLMGAHFSSNQYQKIRALVLRYCMLSYELTFMQATGKDDQLWRLVNRRLLTNDEAEKLQPLPSKPQVIWTWIAWIFNGLHQQGVLDNVILQTFYAKSVQGRGAIGAIFAYLDTQVPFIYVQLLAGIVHVLTIAIALNCGVSSARWARDDVHVEDDDHGMMVKMIQLVVVPYFYNGCLEVARVMTNPLGDDACDFPRYAFFHFMRREAEAFHSTMEEPCIAAVEALSGVNNAKIVNGTPSKLAASIVSDTSFIDGSDAKNDAEKEPQNVQH